MTGATTAPPSSSHRSSKTFDRAHSNRRKGHYGPADLDINELILGILSANICLLLDLDGSTKLAVEIFDEETVFLESNHCLLTADCSILDANVILLVSANCES